MKKNSTHITIVLDRSGSMGTVRMETITGYNHFLQAQRQVPGECSLTLVQFDSEGIDTLYNALPLRCVPNLSMETFVPRSMTPLYDALGKAITDTGERLRKMPEAQRPEKVIFVIITDGIENASHEFTQEKVFEMIRHQTDAYKWEFVYIGANQDAMKVGGGIGVRAANTLNYTANDEGTQALYASVGDNVAMYRMGTNATMSFSAEQREEQEKAKRKQ